MRSRGQRWRQTEPTFHSITSVSMTGTPLPRGCGWPCDPAAAVRRLGVGDRSVWTGVAQGQGVRRQGAGYRPPELHISQPGSGGLNRPVGQLSWPYPLISALGSHRALSPGTWNGRVPSRDERMTSDLRCPCSQCELAAASRRASHWAGATVPHTLAAMWDCTRDLDRSATARRSRPMAAGRVAALVTHSQLLATQTGQANAQESHEHPPALRLHCRQR